MRHAIVVTLVVTIALLGFTGIAICQQPPAPTFKPNNLVGEWEGEWRTSTESDAVYLTIKKIEGNQVFGTSYIRGRAKYHNRDRAFTGTLQGDTLSGSNPTMPGQPPIIFEWQISEDGKSMTGWSQGTARSSVSLRKKK